jgi:hypothetical protein
VWGRPYDPALDRDALDKIVSRLRQRLAAADPALAAGLQSRRGEGYVWVLQIGSVFGERFGRRQSPNLTEAELTERTNKLTRVLCFDTVG